MISDKMLKNAIIEADNALIDELDKETCDHEFSDTFEFKMSSVIHNVKVRRRNKLLKNIASIFIIFAIMGSVLLFAETELGASSAAWIKVQYDKIVSYSFASNEDKLHSNTPIMMPVRSLSRVPEGYEKAGELNGGEMYIIMYTNDEGKTIRFVFTRKGSITIENDGCYMYKECTINVQEKNLFATKKEWDAELFIAEKEGEASKIIWVDEDKKQVFCISGVLSEEELIKMAESVR